MAPEVMKKGARRLLLYAADVLLAAAVGVALGHVMNPVLGHRLALVASVAAGGGTGAGLLAKHSGRPKPLVEALAAAAGGALGVYLGMRWFG